MCVCVYIGGPHICLARLPPMTVLEGKLILAMVTSKDGEEALVPLPLFLFSECGRRYPIVEV